MISPECVSLHNMVSSWAFLILVYIKSLQIIGFPSTSFPDFSFEQLGVYNLCPVTQPTDCTLSAQLNMSLHPLYLLQYGSWIQRLHQTQVWSLYRDSGWYYFLLSGDPMASRVPLYVHHFRSLCLLSLGRWQNCNILSFSFIFHT